MRRVTRAVEHLLAYRPAAWQALSALKARDTWKSLTPCDVVLVRHDINCGYTYGGKAYAPLVDTIGDLCVQRGLTVVSFARAYSKLIGVRAHNAPVSYNRAWSITSLIWRSFRMVAGRDRAMNLARKRRVRLWIALLRKANPRVVMAIQPDEYLCRAGKALGIPVYDLQHGAFSDEDHWYGAERGALVDAAALPTGFLCWDESSADVLRKWAPAKGARVLIVGNPWFARFKDPRLGDLVVEDAVGAGSTLEGARDRILVSLQWKPERGSRNSPSDVVLALPLEQVIHKTAGLYTWLIRMHPVQRRGRERLRVERYLEQAFGYLESVRWRRSSELALPVLLRHVDAHITDMSTVIKEAAWMGIQSAALSRELEDGGRWTTLFAGERADGALEVIPPRVEAIEAWISRSLKARLDGSGTIARR